MQHPTLRLATFLAAAALTAAGSATARAQGLLWKLSDKPNFTVVYYGDYRQKDAPGADGAEKPEIAWKRQLTVKSIKKADGYYEGMKVPCRWIEISVSTGRIAEGEIDHGPAGKRTYTVLVPESRVLGKTTDADSIFVSMIPIAKDAGGKVQGMKQIGETRPQPIKSPVLQVYPVLTLLQHYRALKQVPGRQPLDLTKAVGKQLTAGQYKQYTAERTVESATRQTRNDATIFVSDEVPTGLAAWTVKIVHKGKNSSQKRSEFAVITTINVDMKATSVTYGNARSDLMQNLQ